MKIIPVKIQGLKCFIEDIKLKKHFESETSAFSRVYGGVNHGRVMWQKVMQKLYKSVPKKGFWVGFGGLMWLNSHSEEIKFQITSITPTRGSIKEPILIPEALKNSPKFKVKGKERFYFHEALEMCFLKPQGSIKLPTGSGKTFIEITLAYNQSNYIGTGLILVPTLIIKDQFIESSKKIGINIIDYRDFTLNSPKGTIFISTHHIICLDLDNKLKKEETIKKLELVDWVLIDECAHSTSNSWFEILLNLTNCQRCHGFSALPVAYETENGNSFSELDSDDARTISIVGSVLYEKSADDLKDFLNIPSLINLDYKWENKTKSKTWIEIRSDIINNLDRTRYLADILNYLINNNYKVATFFSQKSHAEQLLRLCNNEKLVCWFGSGVCFTKDGIIEPEDLKREFGSKYLGLVLTSHGIEGLDFDSPLNILLLHEGKSIRQTIQKGGRIVRPDGTFSLIINLNDKGVNVLPKHSLIRKNDIINEFRSVSYDCNSFSTLKEQIQLIEEEYNNETTN